MAEEQFSPEQSLQLIRTMIGKTRESMSDKSIYFLVWGWITFLACTGQFVLKHIYEYEKHYLVWLIVIAGVVFSIYQGRKEERRVQVRSYVSDSIRYLWTGMGLSFFVLSMILTKLGWGTAVFPFFILLYGLGTFVSGKIIRFNPLVYGALVAWALAIASAYVSYDYQILFAAGAILTSYIIPAYLLRRRNKNLPPNH